MRCVFPEKPQTLVGNLRITRGAVGVWSAAALYAVVWFALGAWRYDIFRASFDDGIFTQIVSSAFSGFQGTPEFGGFNHLAVHFSPDLYLYAPLLLATHSTLALTALQAIGGGLVAPPVYWIARKRLPEGAAAACAIAALLYPPLDCITFADFHENGIEPAAVVWLLWAVDAKNVGAACALALFCLGIKEDVAPGMIFGGLVGGAWLAKRGDTARGRLALGIGSFALFVFVGYFTVVRPSLHPPFPYTQLHFFDYGPAAASVGAGLVSPFDPIRLGYLAMVLGPLAGLPLATPAIVLAFPGLAEILATHDRTLLIFESEYAAVWIGYVLFAFVLGAAALHRRAPSWGNRAIAASMVISVAVLIVGDPMARWYRLYRLPDAHDRVLASVLASLPPDADVSAPDDLYAHLGFDPHAGNDPGRRYVVIDRTDTDVPPRWVQYINELDGLSKAGVYRLTRSVDGIEVYERRSPG